MRSRVISPLFRTHIFKFFEKLIKIYFLFFFEIFASRICESELKTRRARSVPRSIACRRFAGMRPASFVNTVVNDQSLTKLNESEIWLPVTSPSSFRTAPRDAPINKHREKDWKNRAFREEGCNFSTVYNPYLENKSNRFFFFFFRWAGLVCSIQGVQGARITRLVINI